jgi:predicted phosphodiesterase
MKILIIPDVHGRSFWVEPCSHIDEFDKVIFLGDYHDPYSYEVSQNTSRYRLRDELVPFVLEHQDKVVCLFGNHDGNYLVGDMADRVDFYHQKEIAGYLRKMNIKLIHREGKYLFSHSGVLPKWLKANNLDLEALENLPFTSEALMNVSPFRGGWSEAGSCVWGDVREYMASEHISDIYQIFGHTQLKEDPIIDKDFACLDCRKAFVLIDDELKPYEEKVQ